MRKNISKYKKAFTSMACFSLILISNNSELTAKYLPNREEDHNKDTINPQNTNQYANDPISAFDFVRKNKILIVENGAKNSAENVLISEIIIEG